MSYNKEGDENVNSDKLEQFLDNIGELPSLPTVVVTMLQRVEDPSAGASDLTEIISTDYALSAKVLRLVNSAFYGFPQSISSIQRAVVVLGFNTVKNLTLGLSVVDLFAGEKGGIKVSADCPKFTQESFWDHSLCTAVAAKTLASALRMPTPEESFVAGLLHDMGKMILLKHFKEEFQNALLLAANEKTSLHSAENQVMGFDHAAVSAKMAEMWNFPTHLCEPSAHHHDTATFNKDCEDELKKAVAIVHAANATANESGLGFGGDSCPEPVNQEAWELLGMAPKKAEALLADLRDETEKSRAFLGAE